MKSLRVVNLADLEDESLIIVDTEESKSYKIVVRGGVFEESELDFRTHLLSEMDANDENEGEARSVIINHIKIGKPMLIVEAPTRNINNVLELGSSFHTKKITGIEVYEAV